MKRILHTMPKLLLIAALVITFSLPVCASQNTGTKQYQGVCCIGDSISVGLRLDSFDKSYPPTSSSKPKYYYGSVASESYVSLVNAETGGTYYSMTAVGQRLVDALYILGGYEDDYSLTDLADFDGENSTYYKAVVDMHDSGAGIERIQNSSLVMIQLGNNDIFRDALMDGLNASDPDYVEIAETITDAYDTYLTLYELLIQRIYELNPYCDIVIVGFYNPFSNIQIYSDYYYTTEDTESEFWIQTLSDTYIALLNQELQDFALTYDCSYADISDISDNFDTLKTTTSYLYYYMTYAECHPDEDGHEQIAEVIIPLIDSVESELEEPASGITRFECGGVDMGSYIIRPRGDGWIIKSTEGRYLCYDEEYDEIELVNGTPIVWTWNDGFQTTINDKTYYLGESDGAPAFGNGNLTFTMYQDN